MVDSLRHRVVLKIPKIAPLVVFVLAIASCGEDQSSAEPQLDENAFIQVALQGGCTDIKNRLYVVDQVMVLSDQAGSCPDASFDQILYGTTVNDIYCRNHDSIAGPMKHCNAVAYQSIFDIMIGNLAQTDLGLGPTHSIKVLLK